MAKLPNKLYINDNRWKVTRKPDEEHHGYCLFPDRIINVAPQSSREMVSTFIHEILHAFDEEYEIDLTHEQIYLLEEAIFRLIDENWDLPFLKP